MSREVGSGPDDDRELGELGRLEDERADVDPASCAVDAGAHCEHSEAEDERRDDEARCELANPLERETRDDDEHRDADHRIDRLFLDEAERVGVPERGGSGGRAVHHDEPEEDEGRRDEHEQVPLELELPRFHDSSSTSRRNVSPRSSKSANWS